jgi:hypothetical protein
VRTTVNAGPICDTEAMDVKRQKVLHVSDVVVLFADV